MITAWFLKNIWRLAISGGAILAFLVTFASDQRQRAVAKIEKASTHAVKKSDTAGDKSRSSAHGGVRDPYIRD